MFRTSLKPLLLAILAFALGLGLPLKRAFADIITDIDQLVPEKKVEKKKEEPPAPATKAKPRATAKPLPKAKEPETAPPDFEGDLSTTQPPAKAEMIPEPAEEVVGPLKPNPLAGTSKGKGKTKEQRSKSPVHLQSEGTTTYSRDRATVVLEKNVMITQDDMRLQSDDAKVILLPKSKTSKTQNDVVKSAILDGKVTMVRYSDDPGERMNAKSDKAEFDNLSQTITLVGNARLWRDGNLVKGERMIYDIPTGQIKIDKAQGVVQPDRKQP